MIKLDNLFNPAALDHQVLGTLSYECIPSKVPSHKGLKWSEIGKK